MTVDVTAHLDPAPLTASERVVAAGGWRRAAIGFAVGALAGVVALVALPPDGGPRRPAPRPTPPSRRTDRPA